MSIPARIAKFIIDNPVVYASIGGGASVVTLPADHPLDSALVVARVLHVDGTHIWWLFCLTRSGLVGWIPACYAQEQRHDRDRSASHC